MHAFRSFVLLAATAFAAFTSAAPAGTPPTLNNGSGGLTNDHNVAGLAGYAPNTAQGGKIEALNNNHVFRRENVVNNGNGYIQSDRNIVGLRRDVINNGNGHIENNDNVLGLRRRNVYSPNNVQNGEFNLLNGKKVPAIRRNVYTPNNGQNAKVNILNGRACESCKSLPDVFVNANVNVKVFLDKCKDVVTASPIKVDVALNLLAEVKVLIKAIIADVNAIVKLNLDVNALLTLDGKVLTVEACAKAIVDLVLSIVAAIQIIVTATAKVDLTVVLNVCAEIGVLVAALLKVCINLVAHIDVAIVAVVKASVKVFADLKLQAVVDLIASIKA